MKENNITGYEIVGRIAMFLLIFFILLPFMSAFVMQYMWNAFIAHIFHIKQLTLFQAYAVAIIINYLTDHTVPTKEKPDWKRTIGIAIARWVIILLILWVIHFFI